MLVNDANGTCDRRLGKARWETRRADPDQWAAPLALQSHGRTSRTRDTAFSDDGTYFFCCRGGNDRFRCRVCIGA
jgi:hypothetical protein